MEGFWNGAGKNGKKLVEKKRREEEKRRENRKRDDVIGCLVVL